MLIYNRTYFERIKKSRPLLFEEKFFFAISYYYNFSLLIGNHEYNVQTNPPPHCVLIFRFLLRTGGQRASIFELQILEEGQSTFFFTELFRNNMPGIDENFRLIKLFSETNPRFQKSSFYEKGKPNICKMVLFRKSSIFLTELDCIFSRLKFFI